MLNKEKSRGRASFRGGWGCGHLTPSGLGRVGLALTISVGAIGAPERVLRLDLVWSAFGSGWWESWIPHGICVSEIRLLALAMSLYSGARGRVA